MTATDTVPARPPARFGPGSDLLGCIVVADDGAAVVLRCPGVCGLGCGTAFARRRSDVLYELKRKAGPLVCPGCDLTPPPRPPRPGTATASLLAVAAGFAGGDFLVADLVVAAWRHDPERWGLRGYEGRFPDSNAVKVELYKRGPSGMARYVERVGENRYRLNPDGRAAAANLARTRGTP